MVQDFLHQYYCSRFGSLAKLRTRASKGARVLRHCLTSGPEVANLRHQSYSKPELKTCWDDALYKPHIVLRASSSAQLQLHKKPIGDMFYEYCPKLTPLHYTSYCNPQYWDPTFWQLSYLVARKRKATLRTQKLQNCPHSVTVHDKGVFRAVYIVVASVQVVLSRDRIQARKTLFCGFWKVGSPLHCSQIIGIV